MLVRFVIFICILGGALAYLEWAHSPVRYSSDLTRFCQKALVNPSKKDLRAIRIQDKVLICGIARNVAKASSNTIQSIENLGRLFSDYRVIIYENNSTDGTNLIFSDWAKRDERVFFRSEKFSRRRLARMCMMKVLNRTEQIARARNVVLDVIMNPAFDGYKYVIWVDLDFEKPWAIDAIVETIESPKEDWDAVLAYGAYDLFALRSPKWPIGFELIGDRYWDRLNPIWQSFVLDRDGPWEKVYSAFGGIGIYKRESMRGCRYCGTVTPQLEQMVLKWLDQAKQEKNVYLLDEYESLIANTKPVSFSGRFLRNRGNYPKEIGVTLNGGRVVWFSCTSNTTLPWTCEHVCFHAAMAIHGHHRIFINPKLIVELD